MSSACTAMMGAEEDFDVIVEDNFHSPRCKPVSVERETVQVKRRRVVDASVKESEASLFARVEQILETDLFGPKV